MMAISKLKAKIDFCQPAKLSADFIRNRQL